MAHEQNQCPKCHGRMEPGFLLDRGPGRRGTALMWSEAATLGLVSAVTSPGSAQVEIDAFRCSSCGFLELYAGLGPE